MYERAIHNIIKSQTACVALKIGKLSSVADIDGVAALLANIPMSVPTVDQSTERIFDCRVWLNQAVRVLVARGIVSCSNIAQLEREARAYGGQQDVKTVKGGGVIVVKSSVAAVY